MRRRRFFVVLLRRRRAGHPRGNGAGSNAGSSASSTSASSRLVGTHLSNHRAFSAFSASKMEHVAYTSAPPDGSAPPLAREYAPLRAPPTASRSRDQTRSGPHPRRNAPPHFRLHSRLHSRPRAIPTRCPRPRPRPRPEGFSLVDFPPERRKSSQRAGGRARHVREHGVVPAAQMRHRAQIQRRTRRHSLRTPRACRRRAKMSQSPLVDVEAVHLEIKRARNPRRRARPRVETPPPTPSRRSPRTDPEPSRGAKVSPPRARRRRRRRRRPRRRMRCTASPRLALRTIPRDRR